MKTILVDAIHCFIEKQEGGSFAINQKMYEMLEGFEEKKILLTGSPKETFDERQLTDAPYPVFTLEQEPPKADSKYYTIMLDHFGLSPDQVIHFEHNPTSAESAEKAGIKTYVYDNEAKDIDALKAYITSEL